MHRLLIILCLLLLAGLVPSLSAAPPVEYDGAESHAYRTGENEMYLYVVKPDGWAAGDRRSALIHFYGGGWQRGAPDKSVGWARMGANLGMVGIAPDYRVKERHGTSPLEAVADARAALRWVQDHAAELGIDPGRIIISGNSAGGHLALWTALSTTPPGSSPQEAPTAKPAALILSSAVSDTSSALGYTPTRFGEYAKALSPIDNLDAGMPPMLIFHGDADTTVPYTQSVALNEKLVTQGDITEFVTVPGGSHNFRGDLPEWKDKTRDYIVSFLEKHELLPALRPAP